MLSVSMLNKVSLFSIYYFIYTVFIENQFVTKHISMQSSYDYTVKCELMGNVYCLTCMAAVVLHIIIEQLTVGFE